MKTDKKIIKYKDLKKVSNIYQKNNQKVVLTTGCYDILHLGHIIHFNYCKEKGDILVVSVGNDKTVRDLKGPARPINPESFRARMIAALECVDYVVISEEHGKMDHNQLTTLLRPDMYVVPITDSMLEEKKELCKKNGVGFITCRRIPPEHTKGGISTTEIDRKLSS
jgi:rfaE bifunctional protein nucleotidyltransferase chain/domain